eukprot:3941051-Rhodomonas_salina.6
MSRDCAVGVPVNTSSGSTRAANGTHNLRPERTKSQTGIDKPVQNTRSLSSEDAQSQAVTHRLSVQSVLIRPLTPPAQSVLVRPPSISDQQPHYLSPEATHYLHDLC